MIRGQRYLCNLKKSLFLKKKTTPNASRLYYNPIKTFQKLEEATFSPSSLAPFVFLAPVSPKQI